MRPTPERLSARRLMTTPERLSARRLMTRLLVALVVTGTLSIMSTPRGLLPLLAHVGLSLLAGSGVVWLATFPLMVDTEQHRGVIRFVLEESRELR